MFDAGLDVEIWTPTDSAAAAMEEAAMERSGRRGGAQ
jgi:hypothetical protein